jgi:hypothetical protein
MRTFRWLGGAAGLGLLAFTLGCSSSHTASAVPMSTTPQTMAPAFVSTVTTLAMVSAPDMADPTDVDTLNLQGLDTADDDTVFNSVLGN